MSNKRTNLFVSAAQDGWALSQLQNSETYETRGWPILTNPMSLVVILVFPQLPTGGMGNQENLRCLGLALLDLLFQSLPLVYGQNTKVALFSDLNARLIHL